MSQNAPNPFSGEAEIRYQVPQTAISAYIGIYNLNGLQIQQYPLEKGAGTITISAGNLSSGIYIYSLIIDGEEVETRRMVVQ
ncbi:MAG: T9SS type A sorting domain-containing protein [Bacteroidales bacterium]|nr:T9SS type A sorting domain-containing protein [Bacteroidales bacterium]